MRTILLVRYAKQNTSKYKVGDRPVVKLTSGRIVVATAKLSSKRDTARLQVSFGDETALVYLANRSGGSLKAIHLGDTGVQQFDRFFDRFPTEVPLFSVV